MAKSFRGLCLSDVDGTIVHYPKELCKIGDIAASDSSPTGIIFTNKVSNASFPVIALPLSSTGQQGYISLETLQLVRRLREGGVAYVIISGARYSTILERLPFMPTADAYVVENGGRIFYEDPEKLTPFAEDKEWRETHSDVVGSSFETSKPLEQRQATLWNKYREMEADGWTLDCKSYTTEFRVKVNKSAETGKSSEELQKVLSSLPSNMDSSFNLGAADIYPNTSGKHRAALRLMEHFGQKVETSVCMMDDDNDLKMAAEVAHAFLPSVACQSVYQAVEKTPQSFTVAEIGGFEGTHEALLGVLARFGIPATNLKRGRLDE